MEDPGKPIGALHQPEPPSQRIPRDARLERRHPPSEPNYLWLEGGTDYGIVDDNDPAQHHLANKDHLVSLLTQAGISWKAYQQGIDGTRCPLQSQELYAAKHDPFVFFDDVTDGNNPRSATCTAHVRPLEELSADLQSGSVARYNFIAPDLCNDMHGSAGCPVADDIAAGDAWLADWIPRIMQSQAYMDGGAILITWDEADANDQPIRLIVLSPRAKGSGSRMRSPIRTAPRCAVFKKFSTWARCSATPRRRRASATCSSPFPESSRQPCAIG